LCFYFYILEFGLLNIRFHTYSKKGEYMRNLIILLVIMLCCSCAQLPTYIPNAPREQAHAVVFDIDGTLTPRTIQIWKARRDAAKAVHIFADKGYKIIYLSARIKFFQAIIPNWLKKNGFPEGSIHVPERAEDYMNPTHFKIRILRDFLEHGWTIEFAFGDSSADFEAYSAVGLPNERIFALRRDGETLCQPGAWKICLNGWAEYIDLIEK